MVLISPACSVRSVLGHNQKAGVAAVLWFQRRREPASIATYHGTPLEMTIPRGGLFFGPAGHFTLQKHEIGLKPTRKPRAEVSYQFTALEFTEPGTRVFLGP